MLLLLRAKVQPFMRELRSHQGTKIPHAHGQKKEKEEVVYIYNGMPLSHRKHSHSRVIIRKLIVINYDHY